MQTTLATARLWLDQVRRNGAICPCCDQPAKVYKRKLNGTMAYALAQLYRNYRTTGRADWLHVPNFLSSITTTATIRGGDWAKLRLWDLIEPQPGERDDGSTRTGYYRISQTGIAFVELRWQTPRHVLIYNQEVLGYEGPDVLFTDVIGDKFDYNELMAA
jgi:hypothetical protein